MLLYVSASSLLALVPAAGRESRTANIVDFSEGNRAVCRIVQRRIVRKAHRWPAAAQNPPRVTIHERRIAQTPIVGMKNVGLIPGAAREDAAAYAKGSGARPGVACVENVHR